MHKICVNKEFVGLNTCLVFFLPKESSIESISNELKRFSRRSVLHGPDLGP